MLTWNDSDYDASYRTFIDGADLYSSAWTVPKSPFIISDQGNQIGFVFAKKPAMEMLDITTDEVETMNVRLTAEYTMDEALDNLLNNDKQNYKPNASSGNIPNIVSTASFEGDDTEVIQKALDYLDSIGGGILQLEARTYEISIASSIDNKVCVLVPKNVHIRGAGMDATVIKRLPSERGQNGLLFANRYYDSKGNYEADGNIMYSDFTITDGAATPNRGLGDLIAVTHSHDTIIERVKSLNHDQHFVDISGSYNTIIRDCVSHNKVNADAAAVYQIDFGAGTWGTLNSEFRGDVTTNSNPSKKVLIENCIITCSYATNPIHYHNDTSCEDVVINNCFFNITGTVSQRIIGTDNVSVPKGLTITNNTFYIDNANAHAIGIYGPGASNIFINNNVIKGTCKGIVVSSSSATNVNICHNNINTQQMAITVKNVSDVRLIFNTILNTSKYDTSNVTVCKLIDEDTL